MVIPIVLKRKRFGNAYLIDKMTKILFNTILFFFFSASLSQAQNSSDEIIDEFSYFNEFSVIGIGSSENYAPYWFHTNTNSAIGQFSNISTTASVGGSYKYKENVSLEIGAAFFYRDNIVVEDFQRRDLYAQIKINWLKVTLGAKSQDVEVDGLSATNKNFLWSGDARPLPGLIIEANKPLKINNWLGIDWGIAHYNLNDDRFVDNARVHYKRLGAHIKLNKKNRFYARIQHFAQWGGTSQTEGPQEDDFGAFVDVFIAKQTGSRFNALGNHLGSYLFDYYWSPDIGTFNFYHEHPFEDGSGTRLANFPDGVWGIVYSPKKNKFINNVLYEFIDTTDQSGEDGSGKDSYFNNRVYKSGWYYEGQNIGLPFLIVRINSRVTAHQLGLSGKIKNIDLVLKSTYVNSIGTFFEGLDYDDEAIYTFAKASYNIERYGMISLLVGYDISTLNNNVLGAGLEYRVKF
ncbi:MAG: capsule assembly Wzi family protein [Patiriisocius sp.]|uniref:capsule assembly Wzi family protein n=1 Tax=Patiriisocius sp. TaxID=2822396 RepID=UPI003EF3467C